MNKSGRLDLNLLSRYDGSQSGLWMSFQFRIEDSTLRFCDDAKDRGQYDLTGLESVRMLDQAREDYVILLVLSSAARKNIYLRATNKQEQELWFAAFQNFEIRQSEDARNRASFWDSRGESANSLFKRASDLTTEDPANSFFKRRSDLSPDKAALSRSSNASATSNADGDFTPSGRTSFWDATGEDADSDITHAGKSSAIMNAESILKKKT